MPRLDLIVGARPNFMKAAPVVDELRRRHADWCIEVVHTGQHYDDKMSDLFFRQLGMPRPSVNLGVGSGTAAIQTAKIMVALEERFTHSRPDLVIVFGDVNSTLATALVTSKMALKLAHVEAGLRSFDRSMPEEVNRVLTDAVSDLLFVTEPSGIENLRHEGVAQEKVFFVGNTMIDTLMKHRQAAADLEMAARSGLAPGSYAVVTLHRPANVDDPPTFDRLFGRIAELAHDHPVVFPVHPRTRARIADSAVMARGSQLRLVEPLGYLEFIGLLQDAGVVLTDSGGIQEEALVLRVPCVTLRPNTERPVTLVGAANILVGDDVDRMASLAKAAFRGEWRAPRSLPEKWDGHAAERLVEVIDSWFESSSH